ncbi:MAG: hypothetical protein ACYC59_03210 [Anaerolineaceae bacterium]
MYFLDIERAAHILESEQINPGKIQYILNNYPPLNDKLGLAVEQWLNNQPISNVEVEGLLLSDVMEKRHSHFLSAIRDMNKLLDPTLPHEKHDQWRRILSTPIYYE